MAALWLACAFLAGIVAGDVGLVLLVPLLAGTVLLAGWRRLHLMLAIALAALIVAGYLRAAIRPAVTRNDVAYFNGRTVQLNGMVAAEPDVRDTGANYVVAITDMVRGRATVPVAGRVMVHTSRAVAADYGDAVVLTGKLLEPTNGVVPYRSILARQGIASEMEYPRLLDEGPTAETAGQIPERVRAYLESGINSWLPGPEASLLVAITLGAHSASLGALASPLVATGLIHIIAISGIKVALIAGLLYAAVRRYLSRLPATIVSIAALWGYVLVTGSTVSGERSAFMWTLVFLATYLGRNTVALVSLAVTAALMAAWDPAIVADPAFQMSTLGTASIVSFANLLGRPLRRLPATFSQPLAVTLAAQIGTLPVVVLSFHVISLSGPLANALMLPLLPFLILAGFALGTISGSALIAAPLASIVGTLLRASAWVVVRLGRLPADPAVVGMALPLTVLYFGVLSFFAVNLLRRQGWAPIAHYHGVGRELQFGALVALALASALLVHASSSRAPRLVWLGTGEGMLLESSGQSVLIDGGPRPSQLLADLADEIPGQHRIAAIIVDDSRASNVTGLNAVLAHYSVGEVLDTGVEYPSSTYASWVSGLVQRRVPRYRLRTGSTLRIGTTVVTALAPDALYPRTQDSNGMLRVRIGHTVVVIASAADVREQTEALFRPLRLRGHILVLDGRSGFSEDFQRRVGASRVYALGKVPGAVSLRLPGTVVVPGP